MSKLTLINGLIRHSGAALVLSPRPGTADPCCCSGPCEILEIRYDWIGTGKTDLDTGTTFLGTKAGYGCANNSPYMSWRDITGTGATESVFIYFKAALDNNEWAGSTTVNLAAGWYSSAGGSGPAKVRVICHSDPAAAAAQEKQIAPGSQSSCASTNVGSVTINEDGTFTLN